jgi:predicted dehydrogenase
MPKQINLGIIGAGNVSRLMHIPALLRLKGKYRISSICDIDFRTLQRLTGELKISSDTLLTIYPDDIIKNPHTDAVAVLTPTSTHLAYTLSSLNNKKHVFLEKPATVNVKDIFKIKSAEKKNKRLVQVGMVLRYSSFYQELVKIISSGKYGKVLWMNWLETRPFDPAMWRYNNTSKNGDAIIHDKAIHQINLFNTLAGAKPKYITALGGQYLINSKKLSRVRAFTKEVMLKGESNDHLMALIQYKNGVKASLTVSYVSPHARESRWIIQLEKAKIVAHFETFVDAAKDSKKKWEGNPSSIYLFKDDKDYSVPWKYPMSYPPSDKNLVFYDEYKNEPLHPGSTAQWLEFYDAVTKNKKPLCGTDLAIEDTIITDAIAKSIKQHKTVHFK